MKLPHLPLSLQADAQVMFDRMKVVEARSHVSRITAMFGASLKTPIAVPRRIMTAHFYMWMAYTLYDQLLDGEAAITTTLPLANVFQRTAMRHDPSLGKAFLRMDAANAWELHYARAKVADGCVHLTTLPDYGDGTILAERAYGHIAGCCVLVPAAAHGLSLYVIARQLNDDLHDWVDDLMAGRLSYVVTRLLHAAGVKQGLHNLDTLLPLLKRIFWETELESICRQVHSYGQEARRLLVPYLVGESAFDHHYIMPVITTATQALEHHAAHKALLASAV